MTSTPNYSILYNLTANALETSIDVLIAQELRIHYLEAALEAAEAELSEIQGRISFPPLH